MADNIGGVEVDVGSDADDLLREIVQAAQRSADAAEDILDELHVGLDVSHFERVAYEAGRDAADRIEEALDNLTASIVADPDTAYASARMSWLTRPRTVDIFARVDPSSIAGVIASFSGLSLVTSAMGRLQNMLLAVPQAAPRIALVSTAIMNIGAAALSSLGGLLGVGASLASIANTALVLPGIFAGFGAGIAVTAMALADMGTVLEDLGPQFTALQDAVSESFWAEAEAPIRNMVGTLLPLFRAELAETATTVGQFFAGLSEAATSAFDAETLASMFDPLRESIEIATGTMQPLMNSIATLGTVGAQYLPRLATWADEVATRFDKWLQAAADSGELQQMIDTGIQALSDLGRVIVGVTQFFQNLWAAAQAGGFSTTLGVWADGLASLNEAMSGPAFQGAMSTFFAGAREGMAALGPGIQALGDMFVGLAPTIGQAMGQAGTILGTALEGIANALNQPAIMQGLTNMFDGIYEAVLQLVPALAPLGGLVGSLATLIGQLLAAVAPVVSVLVAGLAPALSTVAEALGPVINALGGALTQVGAALVPVFDLLAKALAEMLPLLAPIATFLGEALASAITALMPILSAVVQGITQLVTTILPMVVPLLQPIVAAWLQLVQALAPVYEQLLNQIVPMFTQLIEGIFPSLVQIITAVLPVIVQLGQIFAQLASVALPIFFAAVQAMLPIVTTVFQAVANVITVVMNVISGVITTVIAAISGDWLGTWNGIRSVATTIWNALSAMASVVFNALRATITTVLNGISSFWSSAWSGIQSIASSVWNAIVSFITGAMKSVISSISNGVSSARNFVSSAFNAIVSLVSSAMSSFISAVSNGVSSVLSTIGSLPGRIRGFFAGAGSWLINAGRSIIQGLINGITSMIGNAVSAVSSAVSRVRDLFPFSPAKEGPFSGSGWVSYSGEAIARAFGDSIRSNMGRAVNDAAALAQGVRDALTAGPDMRAPRLPVPVAAPQGTTAETGAPGLDAMALATAVQQVVRQELSGLQLVADRRVLAKVAAEGFTDANLWPVTVVRGRG